MVLKLVREEPIAFRRDLRDPLRQRVIPIHAPKGRKSNLTSKKAEEKIIVKKGEPRCPLCGNKNVEHWIDNVYWCQECDWKFEYHKESMNMKFLMMVREFVRKKLKKYLREKFDVPISVTIADVRRALFFVHLDDDKYSHGTAVFELFQDDESGKWKLKLTRRTIRPDYDIFDEKTVAVFNDNPSIRDVANVIVKTTKKMFPQFLKNVPKRQEEKLKKMNQLCDKIVKKLTPISYGMDVVKNCIFMSFSVGGLKPDKRFAKYVDYHKGIIDYNGLLTKIQKILGNVERRGEKITIKIGEKTYRGKISCRFTENGWFTITFHFPKL